MFDKFIKSGNFKLLQNSIENGDNISVFGLNIGEKLALLDSSANIFYVVDSVDNASIIYDKFKDMGRNPCIIKDNINPLSSEFEDCYELIENLSGIKNGEIDTIIITPKILASVFPNPKSINEYVIKKGDNLDVVKFSKTLIEYGYKRVELVTEKGQFSVRGDVLDIYPIGAYPTRIMTSFDEVESIRLYNPITLLTTTELSECKILKNRIYNVNFSDVNNFYQDHKIKKDDLYFDLENGTNIDYRFLAFDNNFNSKIFDYISEGIIVFDGAKNVYDELEKYVLDFKNRVMDSSLKKVMADRVVTLSQALKFPNYLSLIAFHYITQNNRIFKPNKVFNIRTLPSVNYTGNWGVLELDIANFARNNYTIILCTGSNEQSNRLLSYLNGKFRDIKQYNRISMCELNAINIVTRKFPLDIVLPEEKLVVISTDKLFGKPKKVIDADNSFFDGEVPNDGDFVVHNFHGVGKCLGVKTLTLSDAPRDYVVIEYKNNDKVYLPVENMNQLSKYIGSDKAPAINKIGGVEFAKTKEKIKSAVKKIAFDLIALYRERMNLKGYKYTPDDDLQNQFEKDFGFAETIDQLKAINDCKNDMEDGKVMDRLVCGDVGFGKTEVALRIAFKTILNGKQAVFLCPTTILSEQHYNTAKARMSNFGVKIEVLNRLRSKVDEMRIKKDFADGKIDLLCGTHKLLSKDIDYKNLGLLVLDEEQKFGVADKEKIKNMKKNINVLTLSATPIPRTLNMSLIGVRDISVIETPPNERVPSDVQVVEYNENIIKMAIERELERGGQVLVVYNRVEKIYNFASKIKCMVPNAVVSVAHGQMNESELEKEIYNLYTGKTQVLVATTLIENGVDLPNANTLIVINSDMLGLSQLYQLKGRIGRSDKHSYAYFTFDNRKILTESAYKRLHAIKEFGQMGSGFKIAMRDLEIRGAGSLLGAEQSGHIEKLGYNMYVDLINESVKELRGEKIEEKTDIKVETSISAYLPSEYVPSTSRRMSMYKEISDIDTKDKLNEFISNTENVFGKTPVELKNLSKIALIKNLLCKKGVKRVVIKSIIKIVLESKEYLNKELIDAIGNLGEQATLSVSDLPVVEIRVSKGENVIEFLLKFIEMFTKF